MKILVPVDGSANALRAASYAAEKVKKDPATAVTLLTAVNVGDLEVFVESLVPPFLDKEKYVEACVEFHRPALEKAKSIFEEQDLPVKAVLEIGDPATVISEYVRKNNIDSIIMGRRGLGNLKGVLLGSVSQKVLHLTEVPVTLVK